MKRNFATLLIFIFLTGFSSAWAGQAPSPSSESREPALQEVPQAIIPLPEAAKHVSPSPLKDKNPAVYAPQMPLYQPMETEPIPLVESPADGQTSGAFGIISFSAAIGSGLFGSVLAFILGPFSLFPMIFLSILAIAFGIVGANRRRKNRGFAIAGLVLGCLNILLSLLGVIAVLLFMQLL